MNFPLVLAKKLKKNYENWKNNCKIGLTNNDLYFMNDLSKPKRKELKKTAKVLNFWYRVLLESEHMDDLKCRLEFQSALLTIENLTKKREV